MSGAHAALLTAGRRVAAVVAGLLIFGFSWFYRFNDPGGTFAGLTDDHFFYVVRGWQILFGDLPVRDFVDHGAPLYYYVAAAVQWFERGTFSEIAFSVTMLSAAAALTFALAARASGSIAWGALAAFVQVLLEPRFYNYPKLLVYTMAIPLLWRFADRPDAWTRFWLAVVTAIAFLFRHDHALFIAIAFFALLIVTSGARWRDALRHALLYSAVTLALLTPYLLFIQLNGGIGMYFRDAAAWAARDRARAPVVWPALGDDFVAWMFYLELALPIVALLALSASRDGFRPQWPHAIPKLAAVAVLGLALNAGFLRHPLEARLADPSVPHAILLAWLMAAAVRAITGRASLPVRVGLVAFAIFAASVLIVGLGNRTPIRLQKAGLTDGMADAIERAGRVRDQLREDWELASWRDRPGHSELIDLSLYLNACTAPGDRILMQQYAPQVLALARRAFAGGHADLRPGFFTTREAQELTLARLQRQRVPVVLLESGDSYAQFRESFPLVTAYLDEAYTLAGTRVFDRRFDVQLFVRKGLVPRRTYEPFGWPCFS